MTTEERYTYQGRLSAHFRPGAPIDSSTLFCGRQQQVDDVINATLQVGQHVVMFGERGVGKTSLAKTLASILKNAGITPLSSGTINCDGTDDFSALWHKIFRELQLVVKLSSPGFAASTEEKSLNLDSLLPEKVAPDDVRAAIMQAVSLGEEKKSMIIMLDEVDRIKKKHVTTLLADTLKNLSDHLVPVTVILIGVADAVDQLISEHKSIERSIVQVPMPRMSSDELREVVENGISNATMTISDEAKHEIVTLSQGLPHFTHLLALESGIRALGRNSIDVSKLDVIDATKTAVSKSHSLLSTHRKATLSPQKMNLFEEVLLACALTKKDALGYFSSGSVVEPMSKIMKKPYPVPYFARHLGEFASEKRGKVLQKSGTPRQHLYRFDNPLLEPFIIIKALSCGMLDEETFMSHTIAS